MSGIAGGVGLGKHLARLFIKFGKVGNAGKCDFCADISGAGLRRDTELHGFRAEFLVQAVHNRRQSLVLSV